MKHKGARLTSVPEHLGLAFVPVFGLPEAAGQRAVVEAFPVGDGAGRQRTRKQTSSGRLPGPIAEGRKPAGKGLSTGLTPGNLHAPAWAGAGRACQGQAGAGGFDAGQIHQETDAPS